MIVKQGNSSVNTYLIVNLTFIVIILFIITYSFFYPVWEGLNSFLPRLSSNREFISEGLTRSFSSIVRLDFEAANKFNPFGIRIFLFFIIQLIMRIGFLAIVKKEFIAVWIIAVADGLLSAALMLYCFAPFIDSLIKNYSNG